MKRLHRRRGPCVVARGIAAAAQTVPAPPIASVAPPPASTANPGDAATCSGTARALVVCADLPGRRGMPARTPRKAIAASCTRRRRPRAGARTATARSSTSRRRTASAHRRCVRHRRARGRRLTWRARCVRGPSAGPPRRALGPAEDGPDTLPSGHRIGVRCGEGACLTQYYLFRRGASDARVRRGVERDPSEGAAPRSCTRDAAGLWRSTTPPLEAAAPPGRSYR